MRLALLALWVACANPANGSVGRVQTATISSARTTTVVTEPATSTPPTASASIAAPIASSSTSVVAPSAPLPPKVVLHLGDSMVGGYGGLSKALEGKFKDAGAKYVRDWQEGVSISTFDHRPHLQELLTKHAPDLVVLTLGANDVFVPFPSSLASNVRSIAQKMSAGGRACYWLTPPVWKKDTGIVDVIKKNAAPCKVFDASYMTIARAGDGIHPTDRGGAEWADAFYAYFVGKGPATPNAPAAL